MSITQYEHSHLPGVLDLCTAEEWPSLPADPVRAHAVLTAPGDGIVSRVLPSAGSQVVAGEPLVVLEAVELNEKELVLEGSAV